MGLQYMGFHDFGFHSRRDPSIFVKLGTWHCIYVCVYVDDVIVTASSMVLTQDLITKLNSVFALKQFGSLDYFLG